MKRISLFLLLLLLAAPLLAQTDFFITSRYEEGDRIESLDGNSGVLILSKSNDLVITISNAAKKYEVRPNGERPDGRFEYLVVVDKADTRTPKIEISRRGNVYNTEILPSLKVDYAIAYSMGEYSQPIRIDSQQRPNDAHLNATECMLEFTTTIKNLQVDFSPALQAKLTRHSNPVDPDKEELRLTIPIRPKMEARQKADSLRKRCNQLENLLQTKSDQATAAEWEELDNLIKLSDEAEEAYNAMLQIAIYAEGSNRLALDADLVGNMGPREKYAYAVLPLVIEKTIIVGKSAAFFMQASELYKQRKYEEARIAFKNSLNVEGLAFNMRPTIKESIAQCDSCILYNDLAAKAMSRLVKLKKQGTASQEEVARYASAAITYMQTLNNYNASEFYTTRIGKLENMLTGMPLKFFFTVVEWQTLNEGDYLPGVEIWAYHGVDPLASSMFTSDRKFTRMAEKKSQDFKQIGVTDANGVAEIEIDRTNLPTGILFRPGKERDIKIKYMSIGELFRQATGTYTEKRFRLKMFTK